MFEAAKELRHQDPERSYLAFQEVEKMGGKLASDAVLYRFLILLETKEFAKNNGFENLDGFLCCCEKILSIRPEMDRDLHLHAHLFNGYYKQGCYEKAAEHLYASLYTEREKVPKELLLWLAQFYYEKIHKGVHFYSCRNLDSSEISIAKRSLELFEKGLPKESYSQHQEDFLKIVKLHSDLEQDDEAFSLLKDIEACTKEKFSDKGKLGLACCYLKKQLDEEAFRYVEAIKSHGSDPEALPAAKLIWCRLKWQKNHDPSEVLCVLKELQLQRCMKLEPVFLEAAWEYAAIAAESDENNYLSLLIGAKEEFSAQEGISNMDYHHARKLYPEQDKIYQGYAMLFDAKILELEGNLAAQQGDDTQAQAKKEASQAMFKALYSLLPNQFILFCR